MKKIILTALLISFSSVAWAETPVKEMTWSELESVYDAQHNLKVSIERTVPEGLFVEHNDFELFIPLEELVRNIDTNQEEAVIIQELNRFVEKEVIVRILSMDEENLQVILSEEKAYLDKIDASNADDFFGSENTKNAIVTHSDSFGVFVRSGEGRTYSEKFIQLNFLTGGSSGNSFSPGQVIQLNQNGGGGKISAQPVGNVPSSGDLVNAKVVGVSNTDLLVEVTPGIIATIPLDELAEPGTELRERLNQAVENQETIPVRLDSINPNTGNAQATPTNPSSLGGSVSGAASAGGAEASAGAQGGQGSKRQERQLNFKKRHEMYECVFELPEKEDCEEKKYREYAVNAWKDEYEDYQSLLEDIYYDNNCTWQDIVAILFSEQEDDIKCEQRVTEDLEEIGLEQERPSRINRYVTCAELIPETADKVCAEHLKGRITFTRLLRLAEMVENTSDEVVRHGMYLTEVLFEERLKRRELVAIQEEVYHRSDQLWQKLVKMNFNYWKEMERFKFKWIDEDNDGNKFIRCIERIQIAFQWIKDRSMIF